MNIKLLLTSFALLATHLLSAQKTVSTDEQLWVGVFSQPRFSQRWGAWADVQLRLNDGFVGAPFQAIFRPGLTYYFTDDLRLTAGYAYVHHFPGEGHLNVGRPEHRVWQQAQWFFRWPKIRLAQWVRMEERFRRNILNDNELADGYQYSARLRYNSALSVPLTKKGFAPNGWQFMLHDEFMANFDNCFISNRFDQNRLFVGFVHPFSPHANIQIGYMNIYQKLAADHAFRSTHTIRVFYFHNFDLRKKAKS